MFSKELSHQLCDGIAVRFQGEVASVDQVVVQRLQIALVGLGSSGWEDLVVLPPRDQHRRLTRAEILLPLRIERRVTAIAEKQVELDFVVSRAVEQELVLGRSVRADEFRALRAGRVLPLGRLIGEQPAKGVTLLLAVWMLPIFLEWLPEVVGDPLVVGIAVLHHDGADSLRVRDSESVADRRPVVLYVEGVLL